MTQRKTWLAALLTAALSALLVGCDRPASEKANATAVAHYPVQVVLAAMGEGFQENATPLTVTQRVNGGEMPDKAEVTVEESGLLDDSIAAEKTVFSLQYSDGRWAITGKVKTHQCRPERGHQDFSAQPCQ